MIALSASTGQLYVAMHPDGKEGSHKDPAKEIWKIDLATHAVTARAPGADAVYLRVSGGDHPVLFGLDTHAGVVSRFDGATLKKLGESRKHWVIEAGGPLFLQ